MNRLIFEAPGDFIKGNDYSIIYDNCTVESIVEDSIYIVGNGAIKFPATTACSVQFELELLRLHLAGKIGFWIYSTNDNSPITFNFGSGATIVVKCTDIVLTFATGTTANGGLTSMSINAFHFVEISWEPEEGNFSIKVDGVEVLTDHVEGAIEAFTGDFSISRASVSGDVYLDNIIISTDVSKSLWSYRGFKTYTPEVPDDPPTPAYDIAFWLGCRTTADGLLDIQHYEEKDYIMDYDGYYLPDGIPSTHVSTESHITGLTSISNEHTGTNSVIKLNTNIITGNKMRMGWWMKLQDTLVPNGSQSALWFYDGVGSYNQQIYFACNSGGYGYWLGIHDWQSGYFNGAVDMVIDDNWNFFEVSLDDSKLTNKFRVFKNGVEEPSYYAPTNSNTLYGWSTGNLWVEFERTNEDQDFIWIENIIISTNPDLDMYNTMLGVTRLCELAEYPQEVLVGYGNMGGSMVLDGDYMIHTFLIDDSGSDFVACKAGNVECLVVGGGGGGGMSYNNGAEYAEGGGGGGAGGLITESSYAVTAKSYTITVGAGGAGDAANEGGASGSSSEFDSLTAPGGGGGGAAGAARPNASGKNGGCGGGGGTNATGYNGLGGTGSDGYDGGIGTEAIVGYGAGGGGAGGIGEDGAASSGGAAGIGVVFHGVTYATGGEGGSATERADAVDDKGNGGAGGRSTVNENGKAGGSGIVIIRCLTADFMV